MLSPGIDQAFFASNRSIDVETLRLNHPIRAFFDVYRVLADSTGYFEKSAFIPAEHPKLLPWIQIFELQPDGLFSCRLMGSEVAELLGGDYTGWLLKDYVSPPVYRLRSDEFRQALDDGVPVFSASLVPIEGRSHMNVVRGAFPCRQDDKRFVFLPLAAVDASLI